MIKRLSPVIAMASLLAALASLPASAGEAKITLRWTTCCAQVDRHELFKAWAEEYEKLHPDVKIEWIYPTGGNYYDILQTWMAGGVPADVMWLGGGFWRFVEGQLLPLDQLMRESPHAAAIHPNMLRAFRWKDAQLALPYGANTHTIAYNKALFDAAGVAYPQPGWTWDEAVQIARRLTLDRNGDGTPEQWGIHISEVTHALVYGGDFYSEDGRKATFATPASIAAVQLLVDMRRGVLGIYPLGSNLGTPQQQFLNQTVAMVNAGIFDVPNYRRNATFDWDVVVFPAMVVDGKRYRATFASGEAWAVSRYTKYPDVALDFVKFLLHPDRMAQFARMGGIIPTQRTVFQHFLSSPPPPKQLRAFIDALDDGRRMPFEHPASGMGGEVDKALYGDTWRKLWRGEIPAAAALPELERQVNAVLAAWWERQGR